MARHPVEKRYRTYPNRWNNGKVHRYLYDSTNKMWYVLCCGLGKDPYGLLVPSDTKVTCKKCLL